MARSVDEHAQGDGDSIRVYLHENKEPDTQPYCSGTSTLHTDTSWSPQFSPSRNWGTTRICSGIYQFTGYQRQQSSCCCTQGDGCEHSVSIILKPNTQPYSRKAVAQAVLVCLWSAAYLRPARETVVPPKVWYPPYSHSFRLFGRPTSLPSPLQSALLTLPT